MYPEKWGGVSFDSNDAARRRDLKSSGIAQASIDTSFNLIFPYYGANYDRTIQRNGASGAFIKGTMLIVRYLLVNSLCACIELVRKRSCMTSSSSLYIVLPLGERGNGALVAFAVFMQHPASRNNYSRLLEDLYEPRYLLSDITAGADGMHSTIIFGHISEGHCKCRAV